MNLPGILRPAEKRRILLLHFRAAYSIMGVELYRICSEIHKILFERLIHMQIQKVTDAAFSKYGKIIEGLDCTDIIEAMGATPCPDGVTYVPGDASLEACASAEDIAIRCTAACDPDRLLQREQCLSERTGISQILGN